MGLWGKQNAACRVPYGRPSEGGVETAVPLRIRRNQGVRPRCGAKGGFRALPLVTGASVAAYPGSPTAKPFGARLGEVFAKQTPAPAPLHQTGAL